MLGILIFVFKLFFSETSAKIMSVTTLCLVGDFLNVKSKSSTYATNINVADVLI